MFEGPNLMKISDFQKFWFVRIIPFQCIYKLPDGTVCSNYFRSCHDLYFRIDLPYKICNMGVSCRNKNSVMSDERQLNFPANDN
jgi:hypothetical protein